MRCESRPTLLGVCTLGRQTDLQAALQVLELPIVCEHLGERLVHRHVGESLDGRKAVPSLLQLGGRSDDALGVCVALHELLQAPFSLHQTLCRLIDEETEFARAGKEAHIILKMNSMTEPRIIQRLYLAGQAGVKIDLIIRGICCLRPGIKGMSDNISVRSVVGRFLEHTRIYHFHANGEGKTFCASADWMGRNFFRRVETCWPIRERRLADRVVEECLNTYLRDNSQAWLLNSDASYTKAVPGPDEASFSAQEYLLDSLAEHVD